MEEPTEVRVVRAHGEARLHDFDVEPVARRIDDAVDAVERLRKASRRRHGSHGLTEGVRHNPRGLLVPLDDSDFLDPGAAREVRGRHAPHAARTADNRDPHRKTILAPSGRMRSGPYTQDPDIRVVTRWGG